MIPRPIRLSILAWCVSTVLVANDDAQPGQVPSIPGAYQGGHAPDTARPADFARRPRDEADALVASVQAPLRFQDHVPRFSVGKRTYTFHHVAGPREETWRVILDGERVVALVGPNGILHLLAFDPALCPDETELSRRMPTGRWHIDTFLGSPFATDAYIPGDLKSKDASYAFSFPADGRELLLVRHFMGSRQLSRKTPKGPESYEERIHATNSIRLHVDPRTGYTIEGCFDVAVDPKPEQKQYLSATTHKCYDLWPGKAGAHRTIHTPLGKAGATDGWFLNMHGIDRCDEGGALRMRDGGFGAFVNEETGWSPTITLSGGDSAHMPVCNAHADLDIGVMWPADVAADAEGLYRHAVWHRLVGLPPEATRHLIDTTPMRYQDQSAVLLRVGEREDFEDQPRPAASRARGMFWTSNPPAITDAEARSGSKSMLVKGRAWPNLPQLILEPDSRYRIECHFKVVDWTDEERAAHRQAWEKRRDAEAKKGKTIPDYVAPPVPAEAFVIADFYEWSPHTGKMLVEIRGEKANAAVPGWQSTVLEFDTPAWDPFCNLAWQVDGGIAYVDDFLIERIGPAQSRVETERAP